LQNNIHFRAKTSRLSCLIGCWWCKNCLT